MQCWIRPKYSQSASIWMILWFKISINFISHSSQLPFHFKFLTTCLSKVVKVEERRVSSVLSSVKQIRVVHHQPRTLKGLISVWFIRDSCIPETMLWDQEGRCRAQPKMFSKSLNRFSISYFLKAAWSASILGWFEPSTETEYFSTFSLQQRLFLPHSVINLRVKDPRWT